MLHLLHGKKQFLKSVHREYRQLRAIELHKAAWKVIKISKVQNVTRRSACQSLKELCP